MYCANVYIYIYIYLLSDYTRDDVINTGPQYSFSQSLIVSDQATLFPGKKQFSKFH